MNSGYVQHCNYTTCNLQCQPLYSTYTVVGRSGHTSFTLLHIKVVVLPPAYRIMPSLSDIKQWCAVYQSLYNSPISYEGYFHQGTYYIHAYIYNIVLCMQIPVGKNISLG